MPYLHLDLPGTYPVEVKRELASRLCKIYAEVMETQLWRPRGGHPGPPAYRTSNPQIELFRF